MGHSGGGPHALACAALLPGRVRCAVSVSGLAPFDGEGLEWYAGMAASGEAELRAAASGRAALDSHLTSAPFDPGIFTPADHTALAGEWSWLGAISEKAMEGGLDGMVDDDLAYVVPWGFDPGQVAARVLLLQGGQDRIVPSAHGRWLASQVPGAELWLRPDDGHISILSSAPAALDWIRGHAQP
jgi:pimeloyl-ACP methyl ester carboxylesterase